jgi:hypothetical protein
MDRADSVGTPPIAFVLVTGQHLATTHHVIRAGTDRDLSRKKSAD